MERDYRNDFLTDIKLKLAGTDPDIVDKVVHIVSSTLADYEISGRVTAVIPFDASNQNILKAYTSCLIIDGKAKSTIRAYLRMIGKFIIFTANKDLRETTTFDIRSFLSSEKMRGISNRSLENTRTVINAFFSWMTNDDYIPKNPCASIKTIKCTDEVKLPFSSVELDVIRGSCKNEKERAIVEVLLSSGIRVSELVNLLVSDIDFQHRSIHVRHGKGDKERYTYMDSVACDHLIKYLTSKNIVEGSLFRSQRGTYTTDGIRKLLSKVGERANIKNVHPHRFRRTFATRLAARGMDIQNIKQLMGHTNIDTTMIYVSLDDTQVNNSYRKYTA